MDLDYSKKAFISPSFPILQITITLRNERVGATMTFQTDGPLRLTGENGDLPVINTYLIHMHDIVHRLSKETVSLQTYRSLVTKLH